MDQSLRTVATQLLNITTKREDIVRVPEEKIVTIETPIQVVHISTQIDDAIGEMSNNKENNSTKLKFGIPVNSKFGHFEITNPGHAMAMTEDEMIREMAAASAAHQKFYPTTTSMLSTWIQLYPPSTTTEGKNISDIKINIQSNQIHSSTTKPTPNLLKLSSPYTKPIRNPDVKLTTMPYSEPSLPTKKIVKNPSTINTSNYVKSSTTTSATLLENNLYESDLSENKLQNKEHQRINSSTHPTTKSTASIKKVSPKITTTSNPKVITSKNSINKLVKNNSTVNRLKPMITRRPNKNDTVISTSKIEKVTLKPTTFFSQNYTSNTDRPVFITKIKTSISTDFKRTTTAPSIAKPNHNVVSKPDLPNANSANVKVPNPTQVNNVLKVQLKKPFDDSTKIEIEPIRVNPPVLTIEKIDDTNSLKKPDNDQDILENSKIDVKFEFNPEYTNVKLESPSTDSSSMVMYTTTKRPRLSHKRKKNKNRRRKPSSTLPPILASPSGLPLDGNDYLSFHPINNENSVNHDKTQLTAIQESKIEPESKAPPSKKKKPNQTQVQKPIGTQIYNFLSREVMPSVGVMSLVGLGLGLASYFLYPFGGVIARRNYDVEPNYKYNLDEYGGNYGLSEEEVLSKVYSGMIGGQHHEPKYNSITTSEKNPTFYRYTGVEHLNQQAARHPSHTIKNFGSRVVYRPYETTSYDVNYRNSEFKYPDIPTTPNYYERQSQQQPVSTIAKVGIGKKRQFVVGNVPKEYSSREMDKVLDEIKVQHKPDPNFHYEIPNERYVDENSSSLTVPTLKAIDNSVTLISNIDKEQSTDLYEEVEITPEAVAVEHGPRLLKSLNNDLKIGSVDAKLIRKKRTLFTGTTISNLKDARSQRNSVIQMIPTKKEIEKKNKEQEDLNNEILDIIDDALPAKSGQKMKKYNEKFMIDAMMEEQYAKGSDKSTLSNNDTLVEYDNGNRSAITDNVLTSNAENKLKQINSETTIPTTLRDEESTRDFTEPNLVHTNETMDSMDNVTMTEKPKPTPVNRIDIIGIAKRIAEIKLRLGLTILKHASEGLARYIGHIQKRFNGEE